MESWRRIWRTGFAPGFSDESLNSLRLALIADDHRITQRAVCVPPPLSHLQDCPADAACAITFCGWQGEGLETVAQLNDYFVQSCFDADCRLGEPAACRWFLNWYDQAPREEMRRSLLFEVDRELRQRQDWCDAVVDHGQPFVAAA